MVDENFATYLHQVLKDKEELYEFFEAGATYLISWRDHVEKFQAPENLVKLEQKKTTATGKNGEPHVSTAGCFGVSVPENECICYHCLCPIERPMYLRLVFVGIASCQDTEHQSGLTMVVFLSF